MAVSRCPSFIRIKIRPWHEDVYNLGAYACTWTGPGQLIRCSPCSGCCSTFKDKVHRSPVPVPVNVELKTRRYYSEFVIEDASASARSPLAVTGLTPLATESSVWPLSDSLITKAIDNLWVVQRGIIWQMLAVQVL
jgi:hypothetical protein